MIFNIITLFPEIFPGPLNHSLSGKALNENKLQIITYDLRKFSKLKESNLESIEGIELMRALENNLKIGTFEIKTHTFSVNTPKDLSLVKRLIKKDKYFKKFYEKKK